MIIFWYPHDGRKLKHLITMMLKSWIATSIKRVNYAQEYTLQDKKIQKTEQKMVIVYFSQENISKIEQTLKKFDITNYHIQ